MKRGSVKSGSSQVIAAKQDGSWVLMFDEADRLTLRRSDVGDVVSATVPTTDTTSWHYVVATKNGSAVHLYLDGVDVTGSVTNQTMVNNTLPLVIGQSSSAAFLKGSVDEVALYNTVLSSSQIVEHYDAGAARVPANTTAPSISGTTQDGETLTASAGNWSGSQPISYAYQWESCGPGGGNCEAVEGATGNSYTLADGDLETTLRVRVTASNAIGLASALSVTSAEIAPGAPRELEAPSISGVPRAGQTLRAEAGAWGGSEPEIGYQWESCNAAGEECAAVQGATGAEYTLAEGDAGSTLRVRVGASNEVGSFTDVSAATPAIGAASQTLEGTSPPSLSGSERSGQTLTASPGGWMGVEPIAFAYQWQRCNAFGGDCADIEGQRNTSYALAQGDASSVVRVVVTATDPNGSLAETAGTAGPVAAEGGPAVEEAPAIAGTPVTGHTLRASTGEWQAEGSLSYAYQWMRCDEEGQACVAIGSATASSYVVAEADVGGVLGVVVTATQAGGSSSAASLPTAVVDAPAPREVTAPSIAGAGNLGVPLEADPGIWTGEGAIRFSYQWQRCNAAGEECANIAGAGESSYTPVAPDVGTTLRVAVTATSSAGTGSGSSPVSGVILSTPVAPEGVVAPSVQGPPTAGQTLTATPGIWSGSEPISYSYQWQRCDEEGAECTSISGATEETYALPEGDVGSTLRVLVSASNAAGSGEANSQASETVGAPGPPAASKREPSIQGNIQVGEQAFAENGGWSGSRPLTFHYQWKRCDPAGEACTAIEGATGSSYEIASADASATLRVAVTATNSLGSAVALSAPAAVAPEGQASTTPALEAAEQAAPSILAPAETAQLEEQTMKPQIANSEELIAASSELTSSTISKETTGEFAVNTPVGEMSLRPMQAAPNATMTPTIVNGAVAAYADSFPETDTFVRPTPLGAATLLLLRSSKAPTSFSWEVGLGSDQQLEKLPDGDVAVVEPSAGPSLEGELPSETLGEPASESTETPGGEGSDEHAAEETLDSGLEEESALDKLPAAPETTTPEICKRSVGWGS